MNRQLSAITVASALLLLGNGVAFADLQQPDGTIIPTGTSLQNLFLSRGELIQVVPDALSVPETFLPECALNFEVLQRNAGFQNSFGWYNVTGTKPADADLHEFLACTDAVGTKKTLLIKQHPAYLGGEIGFYEATGGCATIQDHQEIFYSEKQYNADGTQANPYIHLIIYNSVVVPKAYYFAWEDVLSGGDNDFDDLTTFVSGIACSGAGAECETGRSGICAEGTMQCHNGVLACVSLNEPATSESCNALDDNCDGVVDDGDICADDEVCDRGTCVPACQGEAGCPPDEVCNGDGYCVDPDCIDVDCPSGEKCFEGKCAGPCDGVVCPYGQTCLIGACKDLCTIIACDSEQVCVLGACTEKCQCSACGVDETCQVDGTCLATACVGKVCDAGEHCATDGNCADDCAGAKCPSGQICHTGECIADPGSGGGGDGAGGGSFSVGGSGGTAVHTGGASGDPADEQQPPPVTSCNCAVVGGAERAAAGIAAALGLLGLLAARRRRS